MYSQAEHAKSSDLHGIFTYQKRKGKPMGLLDWLLGIGSTPDWITPAAALIQDAAQPDHKRIYVYATIGYSVRDVTKALKRAGFGYWGDSIADDWIVVTVAGDDYGAALRALESAGIPAQ